MQANPDLDPETKERWAGIRGTASKVSEFQKFANQIRNRLSGFTQFKEWLEVRVNNNADFDTFESKLDTRTTDRPSASSSDATDARELIDDSFTDFDDYAGSPSSPSGVFAQSTYDEYRSYLINEGVSEVDTDRHLQVIKALFDADDTFLDEVGDRSDYDDLETFLTNNGWTSSEATALTDKLKEEFTYSELQSTASGAISLDPILNAFPHASGEQTGGPRVEKRANELHLYGDNIRMFQLDSDTSGPGDPSDVDWTMQTTSQTIQEGERLDIEAVATSSDPDPFNVDAALVVDDVVIAHKTIEIDNGNGSVRFPYTFNNAGSFNVKIADATEIVIDVLPVTS